jgi:hypothetical protein
MQYQKLTVYHYSNDPTEERRITISPNLVTVIAAGVSDIVINGRSVRNVTVLFTDGGSIDLNINHLDLEALEGAIGTYSMG